MPPKEKTKSRLSDHAWLTIERFTWGFGILVLFVLLTMKPDSVDIEQQKVSAESEQQERDELIQSAVVDRLHQIKKTVKEAVYSNAPKKPGCISDWLGEPKVEEVRSQAKGERRYKVTGETNYMWYEADPVQKIVQKKVYSGEVSVPDEIFGSHRPKLIEFSIIDRQPRLSDEY